VVSTPTSQFARPPPHRLETRLRVTLSHILSRQVLASKNLTGASEIKTPLAHSLVTLVSIKLKPHGLIVVTIKW
jgi:hypothetical protein